ncbi:hypothetical protein RJ640_006096 [Escallonia rubra]|uniref:Uncharacterized protein n=1 Tax=Escallonia rubra TaxID=112253 RepID=A0AA88UNS2_9ASTE|nr:hypothetical protein RJ640_006096 [Escallonia rubra]
MEDNILGPSSCMKIQQKFKYIRGGERNKSVEEHGLDKENFTYSYTLIEGDALMNGIESITYQIKIGGQSRRQLPQEASERNEERDDNGIEVELKFGGLLSPGKQYDPLHIYEDQTQISR